MSRDVVELLLDLIAIPSVSPLGNKPVIDYVSALLDRGRWTIALHPYLDAAGTHKYNLVALTNNAISNRAELAFVCHTDTVPFDAGWHEAVHPQVRDGRVYGRGSCDVKGFLACVLAALSQLDLNALAQPLALILTADEEVGCVGAKHLAAARAFSANRMIIGEPTGLRPVRAGKGYSLATIVVQGKEAHSAFPSVGRSAVFDAARLLSGLERLAAELERIHRDESFDPPFATLNVGLIQGGSAKNIVPGECRLTVEWRPLPGQPPRMVEDLIRGLLAELTGTTPGFSAELTVHRNDPAFVPSPTQGIVDWLALLSSSEPHTIAFGSEAAHLAALTRETVVFGPGDMTVAHRTGEYVPETDLRRCVEFLRATAERFCQSGGDRADSFSQSG
jgi:acetylornithine deacetylase